MALTLGIKLKVSACAYMAFGNFLVCLLVPCIHLVQIEPEINLICK